MAASRHPEIAMPAIVRRPDWPPIPNSLKARKPKRQLANIKADVISVNKPIETVSRCHVCRLPPVNFMERLTCSSFRWISLFRNKFFTKADMPGFQCTVKGKLTKLF